MTDNVLYIIGNGFDCHHGVKSSYCFFKEWLEKNNNKLFNLYDAVCDYDALWQDFERGMAYVSRDYLINNGLLLLPEGGWDPDEHQYADLFLATDYAREAASNLIADLKREFHRWIKRVGVPKDYERKMLRIDDYARFLNFNYTNFLETKYGISRSQINYIHGHKDGKIGSIIVGNGEDDYKIFKEWENKKGYNIPRRNKKGRKYFFRDEAWKVYNSPLPEYEMIAQGIEEYYSEAKKPVDEIIHRNAEYFMDLYDTQTIYVWGFSFSQVDMPYLKAIVENNEYPQEIHWFVSYYDNKEIPHFKSQLSSIGIDWENRVEFRPLSYWQRKR